MDSGAPQWIKSWPCLFVLWMVSIRCVLGGVCSGVNCQLMVSWSRGWANNSINCVNCPIVSLNGVSRWSHPSQEEHRSPGHRLVASLQWQHQSLINSETRRMEIHTAAARYNLHRAAGGIPEHSLAELIRLFTGYPGWSVTSSGQCVNIILLIILPGITRLIMWLGICQPDGGCRFKLDS